MANIFEFLSKDGNITPEKARKSRQMQFPDKTAYVWGLRYRWDPSLSRNPVPRFPHFMPPWIAVLISLKMQFMLRANILSYIELSVLLTLRLWKKNKLCYNFTTIWQRCSTCLSSSAAPSSEPAGERKGLTRSSCSGSGTPWWSGSWWTCWRYKLKTYCFCCGRW